MGEVNFKIGEVARLTRLTVRTLHHYDAIGLVKPSQRTEAGYRCYTETDLELLHQVLCYRELGFSLDVIATILVNPDRLEHLQRQHQLLQGRIGQLQRMADSVKKIMEAKAMGIHNLNVQEIFEVFGDSDPTQYVEEVEQRWGDSEALAQSRQRGHSYRKEDWLKIKAEAAAIEERWATAWHAGLPPTSAEARQAAQDHRAHITRWFYDCTPAIHRGLAEMYLADPRFAQHYDDLCPGLARYVHDSIMAMAT